VSESLESACGQFEQVILGQMLRTAGIARHETPAAKDDDASDDSASMSPTGDDAFSQLVVQSLAGAIERAGGIGLKSSLVDALEGHKP
jgi:hypothetical protein